VSIVVKVSLFYLPVLNRHNCKKELVLQWLYAAAS